MAGKAGYDYLPNRIKQLKERKCTAEESTQTTPPKDKEDSGKEEKVFVE